MQNKEHRLTTQTRIIILNLLGIIFVIMGLFVLLPIGNLPVNAIYYTVSNPYLAIGTIITGIIILVVALIASILSMKKIDSNNKQQKSNLPLA